MNKSDLVDAIANSSGLTKADAGRAVDAFVGSVTSALQSGQAVSLIGFGTFSVRDRAARQGRNPRTVKPSILKRPRTLHSRLVKL